MVIISLSDNIRIGAKIDILFFNKSVEILDKS